MRSGLWLATGLWCVAAMAAFSNISAADKGDLKEFLGTWRGSSTCVNRQIAPACNDEVVVYEVRRGEKSATAVLKADKIVDGQRVPMGELEFIYASKEACWRSEFRTPRVHAAWCLDVAGHTMTGSLRDIPTGAEIRTVHATRE